MRCVFTLTVSLGACLAISARLRRRSVIFCVRPFRVVSDITTSPFTWWSARRVRYNVGLVVAGILAFIAYVAVGFTMLPPDADFEVTIFTTLFQGIGYLFMMGVAN